MFQPERVIGNRFNLFRSLQYPALAPCIHDAIMVGRTRNESEWDLENDRVDVYACLAVFAAIDKAEVTISVFIKLIAVPGERAGRKLTFITVVAPLGIIRIEVE